MNRTRRRLPLCRSDGFTKSKEEISGGLPAVDNLSSRLACEVRSVPPDVEQRGMYEDAEELEDGQFEDAPEDEEIIPTAQSNEPQTRKVSSLSETAPSKDTFANTNKRKAVSEVATINTKVARLSAPSGEKDAKQNKSLLAESREATKEAIRENVAKKVTRVNATKEATPANVTNKPRPASENFPLRKEKGGNVSAPNIGEGSLDCGIFYVDNISRHDVILTPCSRAKLHPGNVFFYRIIELQKKEYVFANKAKRNEIVGFVVTIVTNLTPKGRFLKRLPGRRWVKASDKTVFATMHEVLQATTDNKTLTEDMTKKKNNSGYIATDIPLTNQDQHPPNNLAQGKRISTQQGNNRQRPGPNVAATRGSRGPGPSMYANLPIGVPAVFPGMSPFAFGAVFVPPYHVPGANLEVPHFEAMRAGYFGGPMEPIPNPHWQQPGPYSLAQQQAATAPSEPSRPETSNPEVKVGNDTSVQPLFHAWARESTRLSASQAKGINPERVSSS